MLQRRIRNVWLLLALPVLLLAEFACGPQPGRTARDHSTMKIGYYVLETGRIVMEGPSAELAADPRIKEAYLGE